MAPNLKHLGFAPSISLPNTQKHSLVSNTCPTMKAKGSKQKKGVRAVKSKRPSVSNGTGFQKDSDIPKDTESKLDVEPNSITKEKVTGNSGDATPHRALVPKTGTDLKDPQKEVIPNADRPLAPIPTLSKKEKNELRLDRRLSLDQLIEAFEDARSNNKLDSMVAANRDLVTEKLLYRLTSAILQVETRSTDLETKDEEAANMKEFRRQLIALCWTKDYDKKVAIQMAEARLLPVLQSDRIKRDVETNCGRSTMEVDAFWIVIYAAVAAWEERGKANAQLVNVDVQNALKAAAEVCQASKYFESYLSPSLKLLQTILTSSDPSKQAEIVANIDDDVVSELGEFVEQIRLLPVAAYGQLVDRMDTIFDYIVQKKYGITEERDVALRFNIPYIERASRLVEFAKTSDNFKRKE